MDLVEVATDPCRLHATPACREHAPGRRLIRRIEQRRPQPRGDHLESCDHGVPVTHLSELATIVVQGEHALHLGTDGADVDDALQLDVDAEMVLANGGGRLPAIKLTDVADVADAIVQRTLPASQVGVLVDGSV